LPIQSFFIYADEKNDGPLYLQYFKTGSENFNDSKYESALQQFRKSADLSPSYLKSSSFLMIGKCYMALEDYTEAEKVFEYLASNFRESPEYPESVYQMGRIDFINRNYESSIDKLNLFIEKTDNNPLEGNALYWIAESLYNLGHTEEALKFYRIVTDKYKDSYKYEAANYKIELINLGKREQELVKLLKWSHEESLKERELFIKKEKEYNQAILSYQKKLSVLSAEDTNSLLLSLRETNNVLKKQLEVQTQTIKVLEDKIVLLEKSISLKSGSASAVNDASVSNTKPAGDTAGLSSGQAGK